MKCQNCKREISVSDVQFCPYCGNKLESISSDKNTATTDVQEEIINIGVDKIVINKYMRMECQELMAIMRIADTFASKVKRLYIKADSLEKGTIFLKRIINEEYPDIAQEIIDIEGKLSFQVDISGEQLHNLSKQYVHSLNNIVLLSEAKSISLEHENAYNKFKREVNKESRFRIIGGGFGIKGAIEGMAIAGAANQTIGAFYSMFNSIKEVGDNLSSGLDKRLLYSSLHEKVYIAVYNDVVQTYYFLNYLINRPMNYKFCKDIKDIYNKEKRPKERTSALKLIKEYPYLKYSFEIAAPLIDEEIDLLEYAKIMDNKDAVSYLNDFVKFKKDVRQYLKEDTNEYLKLFYYKPFFKKAIYDRMNVVDGVYEIGEHIKKYLRIHLDYSQLPHEIYENEFTICCFYLKVPSSEGCTLLCTNKRAYSAEKSSIAYSNMQNWSYTMRDSCVANIYLNGELLGVPLKFGGETEVENFIDCLNYLTLKIKYGIPKVFPDNISSFDQDYHNKLNNIFGENTDYIIKKYNRYRALDMFIKYGNEDIMDALEKDMASIESNRKGILGNFHVREIFRLADEVYMTPLILEQLRFWVSSHGYFLQDQEAICYALNDIDAPSRLHILLTKEYIYYREYNRKSREFELYHIRYQDIRKFEYKYNDNNYSHFYINDDIEFKTKNTETSGRLIYQWILFVILSIKYKKDINFRRAFRVDDHRTFFGEFEKKKGGCFITTATCLALGKGDSCYELNAFRQFRDKWLIKQDGGNLLIDEYYSIAPTIVKNIDKRINRISIYKKIWENHLKLCLFSIEKGDYEGCKSRYINMINILHRLFLN